MDDKLAREDVKKKTVAVDKTAADKTIMGPKEKKLATVEEEGCYRGEGGLRHYQWQGQGDDYCWRSVDRHMEREGEPVSSAGGGRWRR